MAEINKVILKETDSEKVLIDLTSDTVTSSDVVSGKVFHGSDGAIYTGNIADLTGDIDITLDSNTKTVELNRGLYEGNITVTYTGSGSTGSITKTEVTDDNGTYLVITTS